MKTYFILLLMFLNAAGYSQKNISRENIEWANWGWKM